MNGCINPTSDPVAVVMKVDDEVRLNILAALLRKGSVIPNIRQLQKYTGYHKATIKSSLDSFSASVFPNGLGYSWN